MSNAGALKLSPIADNVLLALVALAGRPEVGVEPAARQVAELGDLGPESGRRERMRAQPEKRGERRGDEEVEQEQEKLRKPAAAATPVLWMKRIVEKWPYLSSI